MLTRNCQPEIVEPVAVLLSVKDTKVVLVNEDAVVPVDSVVDVFRLKLRYVPKTRAIMTNAANERVVVELL